MSTHVDVRVNEIPAEQSLFLVKKFNPSSLAINSGTLFESYQIAGNPFPPVKKKKQRKENGFLEIVFGSYLFKPYKNHISKFQLSLP